MKNEITKESQKKEAIKRMNIINLYSKVIKEFTEENRVHKSELAGALFWLSETEQKYVNELEKKYEILIFHIIETRMNSGEMLLSFLYVSKYNEEWEKENKNIRNGKTLAFVKNLDYEDCSELGFVYFKNYYGGLVRIN